MVSAAAPVAQSHIVDTVGSRIEVIARGSGPLVVLIPSLGRGAEDFDDLGERLAAAGFRALAPQPRGLGASRGALQDITLHDLARDIAAVIEYESRGPAVVAGHAFGNFVARTTAADFPHRVRGVILLAAAHLWPVPPDIRESIHKSHLMALPDEERIPHLRHAFFAPGSDPRAWLGGWNEDVMHAERAATEATPKPGWWTAGRAPVLDLQPENDVMTPSESRFVPRCGHALLPEQPAAVAAAVIAFMKELPQ